MFGIKLSHLKFCVFYRRDRKPVPVKPFLDILEDHRNSFPTQKVPKKYSDCNFTLKSGVLRFGKLTMYGFFFLIPNDDIFEWNCLLLKLTHIKLSFKMTSYSHTTFKLRDCSSITSVLRMSEYKVYSSLPGIHVLEIRHLLNLLARKEGRVWNRWRNYSAWYEHITSGVFNYFFSGSCLIVISRWRGPCGPDSQSSMNKTGQ